MGDNENKTSTVKLLLIIIGVAAVSAVASTIAQHLIMGDANAGVTGGVVGGITAFFVIQYNNKKRIQK